MLKKIVTTTFFPVSLLLSISIAHAAQNPHQVVVYNNSPEVIYPIAEVIRHDGSLYHAYLSVENPVKMQKDAGLQPGQSCVFTLPDAGWDQGGRVYLYDQDPTAIMKSETLISGASTFTNIKNTGVPPCAPNVYQGKGFPIDNPSQLIEYTFAANNVDYDISSVDHLYLPVAVEVTNGEVGYSGTGMDLNSFQAKIADFVTKTNWPNYRLPADVKHLKIPGAYNVYAQENARSSYDPHNQQYMFEGARDSANNLVMGDTLVNRWLTWINDNAICGNNPDPVCVKFQQDVREVWNAFKQNANAYQHEYSSPITDRDILTHIVGYVTFDRSANPQWTYLTSTVQQKATALEYGYEKNLNDEKYDLNPFVRFVHKDLDLNVYAFSVDDAIGNINEPGDSFTIAVGGLNGIPNQTKYKPFSQNKFVLNYGAGWTNIKLCDANDPSHCENHDLNPKTPAVSFPIPADNSSILMTEEKGAGQKPNTLMFNVTKTSDSTASISSCMKNGVTVDCRAGAGINVDYVPASGVLNIDAPAPFF